MPPKSEQAIRKPPFAETDVLVREELQLALHLSDTQWFRVAPSLPVTYALGEKSPRYIYGEVLSFLKRTQVNVHAA